MFYTPEATNLLHKINENHMEQQSTAPCDAILLRGHVAAAPSARYLPRPQPGGTTLRTYIARSRPHSDVKVPGTVTDDNFPNMTTATAVHVESCPSRLDKSNI